MTDKWDETLRCFKCRGTGKASLYQFENAETPTVESITVGFKVVQTLYGPDFHCTKCDVPAAP